MLRVAAPTGCPPAPISLPGSCPGAGQAHQGPLRARRPKAGDSPSSVSPASRHCAQDRRVSGCLSICLHLPYPSSTRSLHGPQRTDSASWVSGYSAKGVPPGEGREGWHCPGLAVLHCRPHPGRWWPLSLWANLCCQPSLRVPNTFSLEWSFVDSPLELLFGVFLLSCWTMTDTRVREGQVLLTSLACLVPSRSSAVVGWINGGVDRTGGWTDRTSGTGLGFLLSAL